MASFDKTLVNQSVGLGGGNGVDAADGPTSVAFQGRVLAIDWGQARIGLAASDPTRTLASPLLALEEKDKGQQIHRVVSLVGELEIRHILVGLPLQQDGAESDSTRSARKYAEKLAQFVDVPVELVDERYSSLEANERLKAVKAPRQKDKGRIDSASAAVVLQAWLDAH